MHKCWVCHQCIQEQGDHPKHKCEITSFNAEIEYRKREHKRTLVEEGKSCDETLSKIETHIFCLKAERECHNNLINALQNLVDVHKKEDELLNTEIASFENKLETGNDIKMVLQNVEPTVMNTVTLDESNAARDMVRSKNIEAKNWIITSQREVDQGKFNAKRATFS